ncbi:MAG: 50S ribosomal protein L23 [Myxococcales bacterium]|jgi:large subunit ribosomal protein L23|nr:50S ribosomal protein L23 [Myxococcales bacterium]
MTLTEIIKGPVVTEKFENARESQNCYSFQVDRRANKTEIRHAVEKLFSVKVEEVRTSIQRGKNKRIGRSTGQRPNWKRAVVALKEGESIDLFETE